MKTDAKIHHLLTFLGTLQDAILFFFLYHKNYANLQQTKTFAKKCEHFCSYFVIFFCENESSEKMSERYKILRKQFSRGNKFLKLVAQKM